MGPSRVTLENQTSSNLSKSETISYHSTIGRNHFLQTLYHHVLQSSSEVLQFTRKTFNTHDSNVINHIAISHLLTKCRTGSPHDKTPQNTRVPLHKKRHHYWHSNGWTRRIISFSPNKSMLCHSTITQFVYVIIHFTCNYTRKSYHNQRTKLMGHNRKK